MKKVMFLLGVIFSSAMHAQVGNDETQTFNETVIFNQNVGIGTNAFVDGSETYKLSINGDVRANRVKVYTNWADYVFKSDYELPTLEEVKQHIKRYGHLKDIPSAEEVDANGIELGESNKLLLQKIEELTLYLIQQNEKLDKQAADIEYLKRKLAKDEE